MPAIFGSEVFPSPILDQIAKELGAVFVDSVRDDDLPDLLGESTHSYLELMVENIRIMTTNLGTDLIATVDTSNVPGVDSGITQQE